MIQILILLAIFLPVAYVAIRAIRREEGKKSEKLKQEFLERLKSESPITLKNVILYKEIEGMKTIVYGEKITEVYLFPSHLVITSYYNSFGLASLWVVVIGQDLILADLGSAVELFKPKSFEITDGVSPSKTIRIKGASNEGEVISLTFVNLSDENFLALQTMHSWVS